jgi:hypothetical protein
MAKKKKGKKKNQSRAASAAEVPLGAKLQYVGVGMVLGVVAAPTVRRWIDRGRPELEKWIERLTTRAEELAERGGDWMATARERVAAKDADDGHSH